VITTLLLLSALWLGILTSLSPCSLATNIAAISFVGRRVERPLYVLASGLAYTLGRTLFYTILGVALSMAMHSIPMVSDFLQTKMTYFLGPLMIVVGAVLLWLSLAPSRKSCATGLAGAREEKFAKFGLWGAFLLGLLFASALCPFSAALFFSNLIKSNGNIPALVLYGIGTGLPVLAFSFALAFFTDKISHVFAAAATSERVARILTAVVFIIAGLYSLWRIL